jgi:hypothetical protein
MLYHDTSKELDCRMPAEALLGLKAFNNRVAVMSDEFIPTINRARVQAVKQMGAGEVQALAKAFRHLYPHWFMNGRCEKAEGNPDQCRSVCLEIVGKLWLLPGTSTKGAMAILADFGMRVAGPKKHPAAIQRGDAPIRRAVRQRKMCRFHDDKPAVLDGLCQRCFQRHCKITDLGHSALELSYEDLKSIMQAPPQRRGGLTRIIRETLKEDSA